MRLSHTQKARDRAYSRVASVFCFFVFSFTALPGPLRNSNEHDVFFVRHDGNRKVRFFFRENDGDVCSFRRCDSFLAVTGKTEGTAGRTKRRRSRARRNVTS